MLINRNNIVIPACLLVTTPILVWISLYVLKNPDMSAYTALLQSSSGFGLSIEPTIYVFSVVAIFFANMLMLDPVFLFYFQYIFLIQFFLILGFYNIVNRSLRNASFLLILWFLVYGVIHCLIQVRFGLANAVFLYTFSLLYNQSKTIKNYLLSFLAIFTHYSSVFAVISLLFIRLRKNLLNQNSYKMIHFGFIAILILFKLGSILNILPDFMLARLSGYLDEGVSQSSLGLVYVSLACYLILILAPNVDNEKIKSLRVYGALGFLPYFIVPDLEIIVRIGIYFQYLLLPYLFLTFTSKRFVLFTTLPLLIFYGYKIYTAFNAFIGYL